MTLITHPNLAACDDFYEALIATHHGLSNAQSHALNARLVLLLANHIGQHAVLLDALQLARTPSAAAALAEATACDEQPAEPRPPAVHAMAR